MKNLANCKPSEFLAQTFKIKKEVEVWLKKCGMLEIRSKLPKLEPIPENASDDEKADIVRLNRQRMREKGMENFMEVLENALDKNADGTLRILALCCFIEPEDVDNHTMSEYLGCFNEILGDKNVLDFFTSLVRLGQMNLQGASAT